MLILFVIIYFFLIKGVINVIFSSKDVVSTVGLNGDSIRAYNSMKAVASDPDNLAREISKWSPDVVFKVLSYDAGKVFNVGGYFISAGVDVLDPNVWKGMANLKLNLSITKLNNDGVIDVNTFATLRNKIASEPAYVNKMIIIYKLQQQGKK